MISIFKILKCEMTHVSIFILIIMIKVAIFFFLWEVWDLLLLIIIAQKVYIIIWIIGDYYCDPRNGSMLESWKYMCTQMFFLDSLIMGTKETNVQSIKTSLELFCQLCESFVCWISMNIFL